MHNYLRAVGFSKFTNKTDLKPLLRYIIDNPDHTLTVEQPEGDFIQLEKFFGEDFGISICGRYDEDGCFEMDYYFPFLYGYDPTLEEIPVIERHADKESYAGLCDDFRVGISVIFYMLGIADLKNRIYPVKRYTEYRGVILSALSVKGKILMPIAKTEKQKKEEKEAVRQRNQLISAAKQGDEKAIESLTMDDLDTFSMVGRRVGKEDILSIVETYFMPRGIECDKYTILADILDFHIENNPYTKEEVYLMTVECNDMNLALCINRFDLVGEPDIGRRIQADIWLQGEMAID